MKLTQKQKEVIKRDLINVGAILRDNKLTSKDDYYSKSLGKINKPIMKIWI